jgi:ketosteroid isomerase-like protein
MPDNTATVAGIYAAFQRGDVPAILATLSPDVQWEDARDNTAQKAGVPWMLPRVGPAEVVKFFAALAPIEFREFTVVSLMHGPDRVVGEVVVELKLPNGAVLRDEELHFFEFNAAGQVVKFRHYIDTAKAIAAWGA